MSTSEPNNEALEKWKLKHEYLSEIPLTDVLNALGADGNQDRDRNKWKIEGVGNIIVKKQQWLNGNQALSGYGAVSLVRHAMELQKDTEAMHWLVANFPEYAANFSEDMKFTTTKEAEEERSFTPPERVDAGLDAVREYLVGMRQIPSALVDREIAEGRLYATQKWDEQRQKHYGEYQCVFIGPSSAEIRSTDPDGFKGCCEGSDSEKSSYQVMFQEPYEKVIVMTEAAVDALSHHALNPHQFVVSTNGAGRFQYQYQLTLEAYRNGFACAWGFDADDAGDLAAQRLFNALFLREALSTKWNVSPEQIDEWMLQGKLVSVPARSPHTMFLQEALSQPPKEQYAVFKQEKGEIQAPGEKKKIGMVYKPTGTSAKATVEVKVQKACGGKTRGAVETFELNAQDIQDIMQRYGAYRPRPQKAKDWNEVWSRKGNAALQEYDQKFKKKTKKPLAAQETAESRQEPHSIQDAPVQEGKTVTSETQKRRFQRTPHT